MILCHACGLVLAPAHGVGVLAAARDHALTAHPDTFGDCTFSDLLARPRALLEEGV